MFITTLIIAALTALATYHGLNHRELQEKWMLEPEGVLARKEWWRLITSGFVHANWLHFLLNLLGFAMFAQMLEQVYGPVLLCVVYFGAIVGGNVLALWVHRREDYRAVGASGGVCGLMFASILLFPGMALNEFLILPVPGWVYAITFMVCSYHFLKAEADNIGHDAHMGGAIVGLLLAALMQPDLARRQWPELTVLLVVSAVILWWLLRVPYGKGSLVKVSTRSDAGGLRHREYEHNRERVAQARRVDAILDKISRSGLGALTEAERRVLEEHSRQRRR